MLRSRTSSRGVIAPRGATPRAIDCGARGTARSQIFFSRACRAFPAAGRENPAPRKCNAGLRARDFLELQTVDYVIDPLRVGPALHFLACLYLQPTGDRMVPPLPTESQRHRENGVTRIQT